MRGHGWSRPARRPRQPRAGLFGGVCKFDFDDAAADTNLVAQQMLDQLRPGWVVRQRNVDALDLPGAVVV